MARWPSSLRARLTLWYTVLLGVPLIALAIASYLVFAGTLHGRTDRFIGDALTAFSGELMAERRQAFSAEDAIRSTIAEVRFRDLHIAILSVDGRVVAMSPPPSSILRDRLVEGLRGRNLSETQTLTVRGDSAYRVISRPLAIGGQSFGLAGSYTLGDIEDVLERIRTMFLVAIPLLVLFAATGGYLLARRSLSPVASMAAQAASITASNLEQRLPVAGGDELVRLAKVVNDLLDRLEGSFAQQRRFVADASHELRTPAAILRTEADVTLSREHRPEGEYRASLSVMQNAAGRLSRIVDELFLLARADAGHLVREREVVYLEDVVHDTVRAVRAVADQRGVRIAVGQLLEAQCTGDADLLGRLLLNLLDNAIRYSPQGGTVHVTLQRGGANWEISVVDAGSGIPPSAQPHIFERFFRVETARSRSETTGTSGAGLGLAIARRIAEMHAGQLELVESRAGRTEFRLLLPALESA